MTEGWLVDAIRAVERIERFGVGGVATFVRESLAVGLSVSVGDSDHGVTVSVQRSGDGRCPNGAPPFRSVVVAERCDPWIVINDWRGEQTRFLSDDPLEWRAALEIDS